jgi:hypothetical protein
MDILAAIAADPTLLPLWAVMLFAAGMYPVGMMFGCSPCCGVPCSSCTQGSLPDTLTVALSGIPETTAGPDLVTLSFSGCYGWGGGGVVTAPSQSAVGSDLAEDRGPITAVSLADGGSGYAKLGRTAPTLSASVSTSTGSGASFDLTVKKAPEPDECGLHYWEVSKITVVDGGTGYDPLDGVEISLLEGDSADSGAVISVTLAQLPPDLTLGVSSQAGTGAELTPQTDEAWWSTPQARVWQIQSVTVDDGGDGYTHLDTVTVTRGTGTFFADGYYDDATLSLITANTEPTVGASVESTGGTGASLSVTLAETEIYPPPAYSAVPAWAVESIAVDSAGTGYAQFDTVWLAVVDGDTRSTAASAYVSEVDANGGIVAVSVYSGGEYFKGGPITAVSVVSGGGYVKRNGEIESVAVTSGGKYYREDASLPPYVADVTVTINQTSPSDGDGAVITAQVEDDTGSPDFGKVVGLTIENGGDGYLAHELFASCLGRFNGRSIVVKRNYPFWTVGQCCPFFPMSISPEACTYGYVCANTSDPCSLEAEAVRVDYRGPNEPLTVFLMLHQRGQTNLPLGGGYYYPAAYGLLTANENVENCSDIDVNAYGSQWLPEEATANVTSGGEYQEYDTCKKISEDDMAALYVDVTWGDITTSGSGSLCGWQSGGAGSGFDGDTTGSWCAEFKQQYPYPYASCFERRIVFFPGLQIQRVSVDCGWEWSSLLGSSLRVVIERQAWVGGSGGLRVCEWLYPIQVTHDAETLLPTGVQLGDPVYFVSGNNGIFPNLLAESVVCQNPGTPTVTISSLP